MFTSVILEALKSSKHLAIGLGASFLMAALAFAIPVLIIPGNTLELQLSITTWDNSLLIIAFALLFGLTAGVNSYASSLATRNGITHNTGAGFFSLVGAVFSFKLCPICISALFSFVGLGTSAIFFAFYQKEIIAFSMALLLASLYLSAKRASAVCKKC